MLPDCRQAEVQALVRDLQDQLGLAKQQALSASLASVHSMREKQASLLLREVEESSNASAKMELQDAVASAIRDKERCGNDTTRLANPHQ